MMQLIQIFKTPFLRGLLYTKATLLVLLFVSTFNASAQLDSIHWIPPMASTDFGSSAGAYAHFVYLSTEETTAFDVTVTTGTGTLIGTYSISNSSPYMLDLGTGANYLCLEADSVGSVQQDDGLILSGDKQFFANYRINSNAQGGSLTAKGRIARGREFYWGGVPNSGSLTKMNGTMGVMAIYDNTTVTIDGYDTVCEFRLGATNNGITSNSIVVTLDAGESYVVECINTVATANDDGWLGARVTSDKDIVMNNGNMMAGVISGDGSRDICIDQTLPVERLGTEYITLRGNGTDATELVIIVATRDNTDISINGGAVIATINEGDYHLLDGSNYSAQNNMYIETTDAVYVYQVLAGSSNVKTIGLNFIPPLSCMLPSKLDNIPDIDMINTTSYTGAVTILTRSGATVTINGSPPVASPQVVSGTSDWVTYLETGLTGHISLVSDEPMAAGMFGANSNAGFAGYFSGFSERPEAEIVASDTCVPALLTLLNTGIEKQWHFAGAPLVGDTAQTYIAMNIGTYYTVIGSGTCRDTSNEIELNCFTLDVGLSYFSIECVDESPQLIWQTLSENNNDYFEIWESEDGEIFTLMDVVYGKGFANEESDYTYSLKNSSRSKYYRLSQVDYDGNRTQYNTVSRLICDDSNIELVIDGNNMNCVKGNVASVQIFDAMGRSLLNSSNGEANISIESIPNGIHSVRIFYSNGEMYFQRVYFP